MPGDIYSSTGLRLHRLYKKNITQKQVKINGFETSADDFDFGTVTVQVFSVRMCVIRTVILCKKYRFPRFLLIYLVAKEN